MTAWCPRQIALALMALSLRAAPALGDGGTLREWQRRDRVEVAVFTDPTPVIAGPVDVSVLVLDPSTGEPIPGARVTVSISPADRPGRAIRRPATFEAATNKLLRAALFELDEGRCDVLVAVDAPGTGGEVRFSFDVEGASAPGLGLWAWVAWPWPIVAIYAIHRLLVGRRERLAAIPKNVVVAGRPPV